MDVRLGERDTAPALRNDLVEFGDECVGAGPRAGKHHEGRVGEGNGGVEGAGDRVCEGSRESGAGGGVQCGEQAVDVDGGGVRVLQAELPKCGDQRQGLPVRAGDAA